MIEDLALKTLGRIDLEPDPDDLEAHWEGRIFLHLPVGRLRKPRTIEDPGRYGYTKSKEALWWLKLMIEVERGRADSGVVVGSLELLQDAQTLKCLLPTDAPMCVTLQKEKHVNLVVLVPSAEDSEMTDRFQQTFGSIGEVFNT